MLVTVQTTPGNTAEEVIRVAIEWLQMLDPWFQKLKKEKKKGGEDLRSVIAGQVYKHLQLEGRKCFTGQIKADDDGSVELTLGFDFVGVVMYLRADSDPELVLACYKLAILGERPRTIDPHPEPITKSEQALIDSRKIGMAQDAGTLQEFRARQAEQ